MVREIELTQGKVTLVDDCRAEKVNHSKWYATEDHKVWYAVRAYLNEVIK